MDNQIMRNTDIGELIHVFEYWIMAQKDCCVRLSETGEKTLVLQHASLSGKSFFAFEKLSTDEFSLTAHNESKEKSINLTTVKINRPAACRIARRVIESNDTRLINIAGLLETAQREEPSQNFLGQRPKRRLSNATQRSEWHKQLYPADHPRWA